MAMKASTCATARVANDRTRHWRMFWLWSLAAVVNQRTEGKYERRLVDWGARSERTFLEAYRSELAAVGAETFDERLLEPFVAEQFCRELLYAEATLPRWRYAPLKALRWRYPLGADDDD